MAHLNTKEIALMGILSALLIIGQVALGFLPNIEVVTLLVIAYTLVFGKKVFFIIYIFVLVEGLIYGFGLWWINYLYVWSVQAAVSLFFRKQKSVLFWSILSGFLGLPSARCARCLICHRGPAGGVCLLDIRPGL